MVCGQTSWTRATGASSMAVLIAATWELKRPSVH